MREQLSKRRTTRERTVKTVMTTGTTNTTGAKAWKFNATHETASKSTERAATSKGDDAEEGPECTQEAARHLEAEYQQVSHEKFMVAHDSQPMAGAWDSKPRRSV